MAASHGKTAPSCRWTVEPWQGEAPDVLAFDPTPLVSGPGCGMLHEE